MLDDLDYKILAAIESDGRKSWSDLAQEFGMSAPGIVDRVRRLEERGFVSGFAAVVEPQSLGLSLTSMVFLKLTPGAKRESFVTLISGLLEVVECHHVTGSHDYLLKLVCLDTGHLDRVLTEKLKGSGLVASTETMISLSCTKDSRQFAALAAHAHAEKENLTKKKKTPTKR